MTCICSIGKMSSYNAAKYNQKSRTSILTHGVSGIDWNRYKHPLPENVYDEYMQFGEIRTSASTIKKSFQALTELLG